MAGARRLGLAVWVLLAAAIWCAGAFPSRAQAQTPPSRDIATRPDTPLADLETIPDGRDFARWYPEAALIHGVGGRTVLRCGVNVAGRLIDCVVVSEDPVGWGFGAASLGLSKSFRVAKRMQDGQLSAGRQITIPIRWRMEPDGGPMSLSGALSSARAMVSLIHGGEPKVMPASDFWTTSPTYAQREAVAPSQGGLAALQCRIKDDGALERCIVFGEGPAGAGLGEAALRLAPLYRARLELDGRPTVGAVVFLDFNFFKPSQPPSSPTGQ